MFSHSDRCTPFLYKLFENHYSRKMGIILSNWFIVIILEAEKVIMLQQHLSFHLMEQNMI